MLKSPALLLAFLLSLASVCLVPICLAQDSSGNNSSWSSSGQQQDPNGALNPFRSHESHTEADGKIIDNKSIETLGPDGRYIPYQDTEKESVRVDATTVRTIERTFGRGPDGQRTLVQVKEEESRKLAGSETSVVRTISNPDANGALQVVERDLQDSRQISPSTQETKTTVLTPDVNGGLSAAVQIDERQQKSNDGTVEFKKSTQLSDGTGHWQLAEVREGTIKPENGQGSTTEEKVLRPDSNGNLAVVERTISKQVETSPGEKRDTTETYSINVPGVGGNDGLQLVQRQTTVSQKTASGVRTTTKQTEQLNPGAPSDGLQVTNEAIDIVRPTRGDNSEQSRTILTRDADGRMREVWVDFGNTDNPTAIQVNSPAPAKPK